MVKDFFDNFENEIEIFLKKYDNTKLYNEVSFQHELGIYLREKFKASKYKVEFERNISFFGIKYKDLDLNYDLLKIEYPNKDNLLSELKHEVDIVVYDEKKENVYTIELKYPSIKSYYDEDKKLEIKKANGAYPRVMYECLKDLKFMEVLKNRGITKSFSVVVVNSKDAFGNRNFYESGNNSSSDIYNYFRNEINNQMIHGLIRNPIVKDKNNKCIYIYGNYKVNWRDWILNDEKIGKYYVIETK